MVLQSLAEAGIKIDWNDLDRMPKTDVEKIIILSTEIYNKRSRAIKTVPDVKTIGG